MTEAAPAKTYCFDLDGTLCTNTWGEYEHAHPFPWAIERVNALARAGHRILIFTARGSTTGIDWRATTAAQLERWGVEYDELILGKPQADVYVDDRTMHVDAWRYGEAFPVPRGESAAAAMPALPPPRSTTVVEVGRTFGGEPFRLEQHAERAVALADERGVSHLWSASEICEAVRNAIEPSRRLLAAGDDQVFTIALAGPPHSGYLDTADDGLEPQLTVGCRLMSQAAAGIGRYLCDGGIRARTTAAPPSPGSWPLVSDASGRLRDGLGGELLVASGREVRIRTGIEHPPVALGTTLELAARLGLVVRPETLTEDELAAEGAELLLVDLPFCVLPVGSLNGVSVPAPGPVAMELATAWRDLTGWDPSGRWRS